MYKMQIEKEGLNSYDFIPTIDSHSIELSISEGSSLLDVTFEENELSMMENIINGEWYVNPNKEEKEDDSRIGVANRELFCFGRRHLLKDLICPQFFKSPRRRRSGFNSIFPIEMEKTKINLYCCDITLEENPIELLNLSPKDNVLDLVEFLKEGKKNSSHGACPLPKRHGPSREPKSRFYHARMAIKFYPKTLFEYHKMYLKISRAGLEMEKEETHVSNEHSKVLRRSRLSMIQFPCDLLKVEGINLESFIKNINEIISSSEEIKESSNLLPFKIARQRFQRIGADFYEVLKDFMNSFAEFNDSLNFTQVMQSYACTFYAIVEEEKQHPENKSYIIECERIAQPFIMEASNEAWRKAENQIMEDYSDSYSDFSESEYLPLKRDSEILHLPEVRKPKKKNKKNEEAEKEIEKQSAIQLYDSLFREQFRILAQQIRKNYIKGLLDINAPEDDEDDGEVIKSTSKYRNSLCLLKQFNPQKMYEIIMKRASRLEVHAPASPPLASQQFFGDDNFKDSYLQIEETNNKQERYQRMLKRGNSSRALRRSSDKHLDKLLDTPKRIQSREKIPRLNIIGNSSILNKSQSMVKISQRRKKRKQNLSGYDPQPRIDTVAMIKKCIKNLQQKEIETILNRYTEVKVDQKGANGCTLLHEAIKAGSLEITRMLIDYGADINIQDKDGNTPAHYALFFGHFEILDLLISSGAIENIENKSGKTIWEFK